MRLVTVSALNTLLPTDERKAAGNKAVERAASANVVLSERYHVLRTVPTHQVLTADDFQENSVTSSSLKSVMRSTTFAISVI